MLQLLKRSPKLDTIRIYMEQSKRTFIGTVYGCDVYALASFSMWLCVNYIRILSCMIQSRKTTLISAQSEMCKTITIMESLKAEPGEKEKEVSEAVQNRVLKGVDIKATITKSEAIKRLQFMQSLVDRMRQRLFNEPTHNTILEDLKERTVIDEVFKTVSDDAKREKEGKSVTLRFGLPEFESIEFRSRDASSTLLKTLNIPI